MWLPTAVRRFLCHGELERHLNPEAAEQQHSTRISHKEIKDLIWDLLMKKQ